VRYEFQILVAGLVVAGLLLASAGATAWWAASVQKGVLQQSHADQVRAAGSVLAQSAEVLLADNELSSVRRMLIALARERGLQRCRIVLPDGNVVADATPSSITLRELPAQWSGAATVVDADAQGSAHVFPITVPGRGNARLEITAEAEIPAGAYWPLQAGLGGISIVALIAMMILYRHATSSLGGVLAIRQALLSRQGGQASLEALEVSPDLGPEAQAWNSLLAEQEREHKQSALQKTTETVTSHRGSSDRLSIACDVLSQGLILLGKDLRAEYVNGAAAALLQTKREDMISAEVSTFIKDERVLAACRASTAGPMPRRMIVEVERCDGEATTLLRFIVRPVRREDIGAAMIIVEDITQQRVAEESRHAFVAQATHELRTPLTNIRLYAEMALDEGKNDPTVVGNCLNVINQEVFRLDRIVGDILSIAEIEAGTLSLKKNDVRLDEVFPELQADYGAQAAEKQLKLTFNLPPKLPVIRADRDKFRLALHNLLGNAMKYTPPGGQVTVTVTVDQGRLVIDVADTGIGMNEEDRQRAFEKFYRAKDDRIATIKGSGLGLAIAREVIRLHGGDVVVQSELNKGSTFTIGLPLTEATT
jgi:signal transduction histidine kinase